MLVRSADQCFPRPIHGPRDRIVVRDVLEPLRENRDREICAGREKQDAPENINATASSPESEHTGSTDNSEAPDKWDEEYKDHNRRSYPRRLYRNAEKYRNERKQNLNSHNRIHKSVNGRSELD